MRAPHLHRALRAFCLGGFATIGDELERGAELPFSFEEHAARDRPSLYEYRPLVRPFVEERGAALRTRADAKLAVEELRREPAARIFARAHAGDGPSDEQALFRTVLLPLLVETAVACGGFDWNDECFERAYAEFERSLFGERRHYAAVAPLVGLSAGAQVDLGGGVRVRVAATGELAQAWPEANGLLPPRFGREVDRLCVLELERGLGAADDAPDAAGELGDAVTALRLATAGPIAAGPVLFERLDWRPFGVRPVLPISATQPEGEPVRLDSYRGRLAADLRERLPLADDDPELAEAIDRWELALFAPEPSRSEQLREALTALLGGADGPWAAALRASVLLGEKVEERTAAFAALRALVRGDNAGPVATDAVRRALVETLAHGERPALVARLDDALLGTGPRPAGYFATVAAA